MSAVAKNQTGMMKTLTASLAVLAALALAGCSRDNFERSITRFRDRVVADAATAEARRMLTPNPNEYDGSGFRHAAKPEPPKTPGSSPDGATNPDGTPATPVDPNAPPKPFSGQTSAPPTVYYYPVAPSAAPAQ
jgi:hypothetical protein